jgi:hypothetical protein
VTGIALAYEARPERAPPNSAPTYRCAARGLQRPPTPDATTDAHLARGVHQRDHLGRPQRGQHGHRSWDLSPWQRLGDTIENLLGTKKFRPGVRRHRDRAELANEAISPHQALTNDFGPERNISTKGETIIGDIIGEDAWADTPGDNRPAVDVLVLTDQERGHELTRFMHLEDGRFHLSGIKGLAGIGSGDTHITLDQLQALHRGLERIVEGLDRPAREGPRMGPLIGLQTRTVADLAADAGVDGDALQRHLDGEGPLSQIAFQRVVDQLMGTNATKP